MDRWDVFIILAAGYLAVMVLVRLMAYRRNQVLEQIRQQTGGQQAKRTKKSDEIDDKKERGAA
jgi:hypothetical protein